MSNIPSPPSINLKLSKDLKDKVNQRAKLKNQTVSKYIRELLSTYFEGTLCKGELVRNARKEFINSTEFLKLIVWMYSIRKSNKVKESPDELELYLKTLKKVGQHFSKVLVDEFDKVLFDIIRVKNESSKHPRDYKFAYEYSSSPDFNFELLEKFLLNYEKSIIVPNVSVLKTLKK